jgi:UDP-N-acetylglucosamine--N-acetylmuramyl-(pentapeptide) pyrophosphoryl-undecaprenol N-acetylglucosamine transferase
MDMKIERAIISGGGTGGHIFPAIAIANEIKRRNPNAKILFVGALGKMEMEKVPAAGYKIIGLPISGFQRRLTLSNFLLPFKIIKSLWMARKIIQKFYPQVVIGVGGYASGPTLKAATMLDFPTLVQEQNSFPGKTNKMLAKKVNKLCTAYAGMEQFFPSDKVILTGNPTRSEMVDIEGKREEALSFFDLNPSKKTILIIGGSLGARTLNESIVKHLETLQNSNTQVLWQCGSFYFESLNKQLTGQDLNGIHRVQFISRMDLAYAAADLIISRAGAISVSELAIVQKPVVLVPSPNVAEDHQTKNAMALVNENAAILVKDKDAKEQLVPMALELLGDEHKMMHLGERIASFAKPNACAEIVDVLQSIAKINTKLDD